MTELLSQFEQFLALFENLKAVAGEPKRLATFYSESSAIRDAAKKVEESALDLEYSVFWFGPKRSGPVSAGFERAWEDYQDRWASAIAYGSFCNRHGKLFPSYNPDIGRVLMFRPREQQEPDPERDDVFDPSRHDGGLALTLGVDHWRGEVHKAKVIANKCQIALGALDYLMSVIGIDINDIFRRWRELPPIFMPPAVTDAHGEETGSLSDLLDNAVCAYVCGAPAAAIVMCRAVLEMVVKDHYITDPKDRAWTDKSGKQREKGLGELIVLAEKRFKFLPPLKLAIIKEAGDEILHRYQRRQPLSDSDEKTIIEYMQALKTLIQKVEG